MDAISSIASLLALCGISSMRMFAPTFLFGAICRFMPGCSWCPEGIVKLAESCPSFLASDFGLFVFGVLGGLEVLANWDDAVKELISESNIDTYVKPVYATLMTYLILTPEQAMVIETVIGEAAHDVSNSVELLTNVVASTASAVAASPDSVAASNVVADAVGVVGQGVSEAVRSDTSSSFTAFIALLFSCGGTFGLCKVRARVVDAVRELDPANALHLNTLLTLFEEGSWLVVLPTLLVFPLLALLLMVLFAGFGWLLSRPLKKIAEKRRAYWDAVGKEGMLKKVRVRAIVIFGLGVLLSGIPVFGYLVTVIALNLHVFSVIALYEGRSKRIVFRLLMRFMKLTLFLVSILVSGIPFVGIVLLLPYAISFLIRTNKIRESCRPGVLHGRLPVV